MILPIVQYGDPVLRQRCSDVEVVDDKLHELVQNMLETMVDAEGVGLAAPQIGLSIRLAVIDVSHDPECISFLKVDGEDVPLESMMPLVFINPELTFGPKKVADTEGCLSIHDIRASVTRPEVVKAKLTMLDGRTIELETDGLLSRAIQHETDHLNGVLFTDRLSSAAKVSLRRKLTRLAADGHR